MKTPTNPNEPKQKTPVFYKYAFFTLIIILVFVAGGFALNRYQAQAKQLKQAKEAEQRAKQNSNNNYKFDARQSAPAPAPKPAPVQQAPAPAPKPAPVQQAPTPTPKPPPPVPVSINSPNCWPRITIAYMETFINELVAASYSQAQIEEVAYKLTAVSGWQDNNCTY